MVATLRLIHIVIGGFWAGAAILLGWFITPTAREVGPGAAPLMQALLKRRLTQIMIGSGVVTVLAGLWLFAIRPPSFQTWQGYALALGAIAAVVALVLGITLQRPVGQRIKALGDAISSAGGPPTREQGAEMARLQAVTAGYSNILAFLFAVSLAGMALSGA